MVFPEQPVTRGSGARRDASRPQPAAACRATQLQQLEQYLAQQPRVPVMAPSDGAAVVIVKFNDYQCPACGQTYRDYKPVLAKWAKQAPGKVKFIAKDYPLERECNQFVGQDCTSARAKRRSRCGSRAKRARPRRWKTGSTRTSPR